MNRVIAIFVLLLSFSLLPEKATAVSLSMGTEFAEDQSDNEGVSVISLLWNFVSDSPSIAQANGNIGLEVQNFSLTMSVLFSVIALVLLSAVIILFVGIYKGKIKLKS